MINSPEVKVGLLVLIVGVLIAGLTLKVSDGGGPFSSQKRYWFMIDNATGLVPGSTVRMAGIRVGQIEKIILKNGKAKIVVKVDEDIPFTQKGEVFVRPQGLLGDKIIELSPGPLETPPLKDGGQIAKATDRGSIDDVVGEVGHIAKTLGDLAGTLTDATSGDGTQASPLGRIVKNIEILSQDLAEMSTRNKGKVNDAMDRLVEITHTLDDIINEDGKKGFKVAWGTAVDSMDKLNSAMYNLEKASKKLNSGEGTLGQLINDDDTINKINTTMDNVNDFLGDANELETSIGYHAEYLSQASIVKSYIDIKVQPGLDRYYLVQILDDPVGASSHISRTDTVNAGAPTTTDTTTLDYNKIKLTLMFAKNFYNFTLRGGMLESSGGIGFDYYMFNKDLRFTLEAHSFEDTRVKSYLKYNFWKGLFVMAGGSDVTDSANIDSFMGAGLFITNDDLKTFASKVSF